MTTVSKTLSSIFSQKGKPLLVMDNFVFKLNKTTNTKKYYRCENSQRTMTLHTDINDVLIGTKGDHSHPPEPEQIEVRKLKHVIKERAKNETTPVPKIYDEETARFCLTLLAIAIVPSQREINSSFYKARRLQTPAIPDSQIFDIPDVYPKTLKGEPFLCVDKLIKRKTRLLLFASREQLKLLFESRIILMDGTFSASPLIFEQVYCLHAIKYQQFLQAFDDLYESLLQAQSQKTDLLKPLFQYFENQWIKKVDLKQWNVYGLEICTNNNAEGFHHFSVLRYFIQSYTFLRFHNRLNSRLSKSHPNIWAFIKSIEEEDNRFNHLMIQMKVGLSTRPKTAKTQAVQ
ncbi:unnamed protein product [Rotaria sordida]|uniref:FLYWCH-type domain-containing protein n=1 Tax=Rotaria sordida TaxID=392033 RepID=A0A820AEG2_9BILA|nr:unnamed protein product [Rotaria sordida]CAF1520578.1 unnamed protein product [Rotaria sordida]CAF4137947.1 unnamed protein product [Rotaria sordida]CAF4183940.1 unnamed protein product [Rotaria sordida]